MTNAAAALAEGTALLRDCCDAPRMDALTLLEATLRRPRTRIVAFGEDALSGDEAATFRSLCKRRANGVPTAYLLGRAAFYGHELRVDERVLVPRAETEHLVDEAIAFLGDRDADVVDVGTGSGALACSIAAATRATVYATEISRAAVEVAKENVRRLQLKNRCFVERGDLLEPLKGRRFDVVVANLPYVPTQDLPTRPDPVSFEPRLALDGGPDGLAVYRRLLHGLASALKPGSLVLLEAAPPTIGVLARHVENCLSRAEVAVCHDYAGLQRYVKATL